MSVLLTDEEAWQAADERDLWVFDKLILARRLGYLCGPAGLAVPRPGNYVVRPCVNTQGMSRGAYSAYLEGCTEHLPPGTFWCEMFHGDHYTYDFTDGRCAVCLRGVKEQGSLARFSHWFRVPERTFELPPMLRDLANRYPDMNIECIGDRVIEVHLRANPDWVKHNADELRPVWLPAGFEFVPDAADQRIGFFVRRSE